jgi:hypothetical protein
MTDVERLLTAELEDLGTRAPHDPDLAGSVRRRARRQAAVLASALAVLVLVASGAVAATRLRSSAAPTATTPTTPTTSTAPPAATGCPAPRSGPLPDWARAGFSTANPGIPMVYSDNGLMLAILFGTPLTAPPAADHNNKILWVAKVGAEGAFSVDARLEGSDLRFSREIGPAPGPSIVDLPAAGCWHLDLRWGRYTDTISLRYAPG